MVAQDVIEEHPPPEPAPWVSNAVIAPKSDGAIRMTLDARNVNKAIHASNVPIPRQEDIKAKLSGARVFSKMDFKSAFWQLELHPDSRYLAVFHANDKLYRYKRLTMGVKPAQGELNMALQPLFAHIPQAHLIHDDLIVATETEDKQECVQHSDVQWPEDIENEDDDQRYSFGSGDAAPPLRRSQRKKTNVPVYI